MQGSGVCGLPVGVQRGRRHQAADRVLPRVSPDVHRFVAGVAYHLSGVSIGFGGGAG